MRKISENTRAFLEQVPNKVDRTAVEAARVEKFVTQSRRYKLITPLFGGGSETKKADAVQIIRGAEIRGLLRFWWRAIRGVGDLEEMRQKEAGIFGTVSVDEVNSETNRDSSGKPKVKVFVKIDNSGTPAEPFLMNDRGLQRPTPNWGKIAYVAFPLQLTTEELREDKNLPMREIKVGVEFTLEISFPEAHRKDVESALWAWETFGGIGGRTRRGFGAIQLLSVDNQPVVPPSSSAVRNEIEKGLRDHLGEGNWNEHVPHLSLRPDNYAFTRPSASPNGDNAILVWNILIERLQSFRQSPRNSTVYRGESHWPEPDAIRRITTNSAKSVPSDPDSKDRTPTHSAGNKFPRGQLGLPIIFKFKNQDVKHGDPDTQTLQGKNKDAERLSSPLILRPIVCADGAVGMGLALETPREPPSGVILNNKNHATTVQTTLEGADIAFIQPMKNASPTETDVVKSFLKTI